MSPDQRSALRAHVADADRRTNGAPWERGPVSNTTVYGLLNGLYAYEKDRIEALAAIETNEMPDQTRARLRAILSFDDLPVDTT